MSLSDRELLWRILRGLDMLHYYPSTPLEDFSKQLREWRDTWVDDSEAYPENDEEANDVTV